MKNLSLVLSGGSANIDPALSLGGNPSASPIANNSLNNLFDNVTTTESEDGATEYRCFYIFNDTSYVLQDMKLWIYYDFPGGASVQLGITSQNEIHRVTTQYATGGSFTLSYVVEGVVYPIVVHYNSNPAIWNANLKNAFTSTVDTDGNAVFSGVTTTVYNSSNSIIFDITFAGYNGKRGYSLPTVTNNLVTAATIGILRTYAGMPINTIASQISSSTTPPGSVAFAAPSETDPLTIPLLKIDEGFPVWVKRIVAPDTAPKAEDGVTIRVQAEAVEY
jgi:hypothetical protein